MRRRLGKWWHRVIDAVSWKPSDEDLAEERRVKALEKRAVQFADAAKRRRFRQVELDAMRRRGG